MNIRGSPEEVEVGLSTMHFRTAERVYILGIQKSEGWETSVTSGTRSKARKRSSDEKRGVTIESTMIMPISDSL